VIFFINIEAMTVLAIEFTGQAMIHRNKAFFFLFLTLLYFLLAYLLVFFLLNGGG